MKDIKRAWEMLHFWEQTEKETGRSYKKVIRKYKNEIREYNKDRNKDPFIVSVFKNDWDGYMEKLVIPADPEDTQEEVNEFFKDNYYIPYYDRGYDCTGQLFTSWYSIFRVADNWVIYHSVQADV